MTRDKVPTMKDVAQLAEVSLGTVSKVLNDHPGVAQALRGRVQDACARLGYAHNMVAAGLRRRFTRTIGAVVPDLRNTFFAELIESFEAAASEAGYTVMFMTTGENPARAEERIRALVERRVDGIAVIPPLQMRADPVAGLGLSLPSVSIDRVDASYGGATITIDGEDATYQGAKHLFALGHKKVLFAVNSLGSFNTRERINGFEHACQELGLQDSRHEVVGVTVGEARSTLARLLREGGYTALFTGSNPITIGALKAINDLSLKIPDDLSLLAFDDFEWLTLIPPFVSAIRQPAEQMGREALRQLVTQIEGESTPLPHVRFPAEIVLRHSTTPPRGDR